MLNKISSSYYLFSQRLFQDLHSKCSLPSLWASFSWAKKSIPLRWFSLLRGPSFIDPFPVSPGSWGKTSGQWKRSSKLLCFNSFLPCESRLNRFCSLLSMTPWSRRQARESMGVLGIKITLKIWLMSLAINGSSQPCFIKISSYPSGPNSIIPRAREDVVPFRRKSHWPKRLLRDFDSPSLVGSTSWLIVGTGPKPWSGCVERVVII